MEGWWSEGHHFLTSRPILCKCTIVIFRQQLKTFDSNNFTLTSTFSFQNAWPIKRKAVYTLVIFHILIHFLLRIKKDHNLPIKRLQAVRSVASGGKFYCLRPDRENTAVYLFLTSLHVVSLGPLRIQTLEPLQLPSIS